MARNVSVVLGLVGALLLLFLAITAHAAAPTEVLRGEDSTELRHELSTQVALADDRARGWWGGRAQNKDLYRGSRSAGHRIRRCLKA